MGNMETKINSDEKFEWLKNLVSSYEQEQKEVEKKLKNEAEKKELKRREREKKFREIYANEIYPTIWAYHEKLVSICKELSLSSDSTDSFSYLDEREVNELKINDSYIRFNLNEDEYLPPVEMEVCIKGEIPKAEWLQFKQVTKGFVEEKCEDFIMNVFQVAA